MNEFDKRFYMVCGIIFVFTAFWLLYLFFFERNVEKSDAYVYVPDNGERAVFNYTDIKMFDCAWCKRTQKLNRHHIVPQSANPLLKDEYTNIVVLCRDCHFVLGHRCNWKKFNPDVMEIVNTYTNTIVSADYFDNTNENTNQ